MYETRVCTTRRDLQSERWLNANGLTRIVALLNTVMSSWLQRASASGSLKVPGQRVPCVALPTVRRLTGAV